jgi:hypothetical protein
MVDTGARICCLRYPRTHYDERRPGMQAFVEPAHHLHGAMKAARGIASGLFLEKNPYRRTCRT